MSRMGKKSGSGIVDLWKRELGEVRPRNFVRHVGASEDLVLRLDMYRKLQKHKGCVNTLSFNDDGSILVSGSDDKMIILWDWDAGRVKLSFSSGHHGNVFQAKVMPYTDGRSIVTCAADGQVRHADIRENDQVETTMLAKHEGRAHKLAIEPASPYIFYSCGEDGLVQHFDLRTRTATELFTCKSFSGRAAYTYTVHLNTIAIDPRRPNLFAVAGIDEYARLYDIRKYTWDGSCHFGQPVDCFCPTHLIDDSPVGITGLAFSDQSELLVSYNDEFIYLFTKDMGLGCNPVPASSSSVESNVGGTQQDSASSASSSVMAADERVKPQVFKGHINCDTVKGVNYFGPKDEYVVSGSDCGNIFIWRKKDGKLLRVMEADNSVVNCIEPHPRVPLLASSGIETNIKIWIPKAINKASLPVNVEQVLIPHRIAWITYDDSDADDCIDDDDDDFDGYYDDDADDDDDDNDTDDADADDDDDDADVDDGDDDDDDGGGGDVGVDDEWLRLSTDAKEKD